MTHTHSVKSIRPAWLDRLYRASIWHPSAVPIFEGATALELKRYVLPGFNVILIVMGIAAVTNGLVSFDIVYNELIAQVFGVLLLAGAVAASFGLAFPRYSNVERLGKTVVTIVTGTYSAALWTLAFQDGSSRAVVACGMTVVFLFALWNVHRIGRERRTREAMEQAARNSRKAGE